MLRTKLFKAFAALVILFGAVSAIFSIKMVRSRVVEEAQNQVRLNLNGAWAVYHSQQQKISTVLQLLASKNDLLEAARTRAWDNPELLSRLEALRIKFDLDYLSITDADGRVTQRAAPPYRAGDYRRANPAIARACQGETVSGASILTEDELRQEADGLAERACLQLEPAPQSRPLSRTVENRGLVLQSAVPIMHASRVIGVIYGGILLNRNEALVDQIREVVYKNETYQNRPLGSATVFLDDIRICTTLRLPNGNRALGTRAEREVAARVLDNGQPWIGRACVINDCFLTAYDPIQDERGRTIGMLYVGMLEKPFRDLQRGIIWRYALLFMVFISIALVTAFTTANRLARPIHRLVNAAKSVMGGTYPAPVAGGQACRETGALVHAFNQMTAALRERESKLQDANESLQAINRNYMEMLGFVAHELKSPVGTILNYVYLLNEGKLGGLTEKQSRAVKNIDGNIKLVLEMIRHYLNLSRIENNELQPNCERVDAGEDVLKPLLEAYDPEIKAHQITLDNRVPPHTMVLSDLNMTREVFENLISNAIKYGRAGGALVIDARPKPDAMMEFCVRNDGEGIPADKLGLLFRKFSRLETSRGIRHQKGTGLGLFITRNIVEAHGGSITVESVPDQWTAFRFTLPAAPAIAANDKEQTHHA